MKSPEWSLIRSGMFDTDFARISEHILDEGLAGSSVFLTGATGFFGLWQIELFDWLRRTRGVNVNLQILSRDPHSVLARHPVYRNRPWMQFLKGDIRNFAFPTVPIDYIIHGATDTSAAAGRDGAILLETIVGGARRVLDLAQSGGVRRVLMISSGAVYGTVTEAGGIAESLMAAPDTMQASSAYGEAKRASEMLGTLLSTNAPFEVVTARCFAFVGAGLPLGGHFAIGNFIRNALEGQNLLLNSTGRSLRSYLYAGDLAVWLLTLLLQGRAGQAYNVGSDLAYDVYATARLVSDVLLPDGQVKIADQPSITANAYVPRIDRARAHLNLDVWTDLGSSIRRTAEDAKAIGPFRRNV